MIASLGKAAQFCEINLTVEEIRGAVGSYALTFAPGRLPAVLELVSYIQKSV